MNQSDMIPVDFKVSRPSGKYLNSLVNLRCGPDMLLLRLFPNAKEVTESFGAYEAVAKHLRDFPRKDPNIRLVVVGDGHTPRTAATFAFSAAQAAGSGSNAVTRAAGQCRFQKRTPSPMFAPQSRMRGSERSLGKR